MPALRQELAFSPAVETYSERESLCVRPKIIIGEALDPKDAMAMNEESVDPDDLVGDEARAIPGQKMIYQPTKQEWDDHNRTHYPFRKWCPFCVKGKCRTGAHLRHPKSDEELERDSRNLGRLHGTEIKVLRTSGR